MRSFGPSPAAPCRKSTYTLPNESAATAATEAHRVVQEQFKAGAVNVTRYLEAEVALRDARAREVVAHADERIARAALAKALGEAGRSEGSQP